MPSDKPVTKKGERVEKDTQRGDGFCSTTNWQLNTHSHMAHFNVGSTCNYISLINLHSAGREKVTFIGWVAVKI